MKIYQISIESTGHCIRFEEPIDLTVEEVVKDGVAYQHVYINEWIKLDGMMNPETDSNQTLEVNINELKAI